MPYYYNYFRINDVDEEWKEEKEYLDKLSTLLTTRGGGLMSNGGPAQLMDHLYLGNERDASNLPLLRRLRISHVINCATKVPKQLLNESDSGNGGDLKQNVVYNRDTTGVCEYVVLGADDSPSYPILQQHYEQTRRFIERARGDGGRTLVHCELGVNRSAALCVAYLVDTLKITLLQAVRQVKFDRPNILCNEGFRRQLFEFARERQLLHRK